MQDLSPRARAAAEGGIVKPIVGLSATYATYDEYLKSAEWRQRRYDAIRRANFRCQLCNSDGRGKLQVHHRTYDRIGRESPADLIALCAECHSKHHDKQPGLVPMKTVMRRSRPATTGTPTTLEEWLALFAAADWPVWKIGDPMPPRARAIQREHFARRRRICDFEDKDVGP